MPPKAQKRKAAESPSPSQPPAKQRKSTQKLIVPVDEGCVYWHTLHDAELCVPQLTMNSFQGEGSAPRVYIDADGVVYDASLNQTNIGKNANKFYRVQMIEANSGGQRLYWCLTCWGRLGVKGQKKLFGPDALQAMMAEFLDKFNAKTGLDWTCRDQEPKKGKFTYLEREYDQVDDTPIDDTGAQEAKQSSSRISAQVQTLVEMIFNQTSFDVVLQSIGYDHEKLPLGKLGKATLRKATLRKATLRKATLRKAFEYLTELENVLQDRELVENVYDGDLSAAIEELSNKYYSTIPHVSTGRQRLPLIDSLSKVKTETEMLDTLEHMEATNDIMEEAKKRREREHAEKMTLLDQHLAALNLDEITPVDPVSSEYRTLVEYLVNTAGATHSITYHVNDILRIRRHGEWERFEKARDNLPNSCRRLLWHGSRTGNFGGILSQGLRIAPPEAPVSGYMFGKGIYLADLSTKSANYCFVPTGEPGLLLICEAELGDPPLRLEDADYRAGEQAKQTGCISTQGIGRTAPVSWVDAEIVHPELKGILMPDPRKKPQRQDDVGYLGLLYNEYIVYDEAQVRLRYIIRFKNVATF